MSAFCVGSCPDAYQGRSARVTPARAPQVEEMTNATGGVSVARIDLKGHGPRNGGRIAVWLLPAPSGHPVTADATARRMFTLQLAQVRVRRSRANASDCEQLPIANASEWEHIYSGVIIYAPIRSHSQCVPAGGSVL